MTRAPYLINSIKANSESMAFVITAFDFQSSKKNDILLRQKIYLTILSENPQESSKSSILKRKLMIYKNNRQLFSNKGKRSTLLLLFQANPASGKTVIYTCKEFDSSQQPKVDLGNDLVFCSHVIQEIFKCRCLKSLNSSLL